MTEDDATSVHPAPEAAERSPYREIAAGVREWLEADSSGHDMHHVWRVFALGRTIAEAEGADPEVVGAAALTHDLHRVVEGDGYVHPEETLDEVEAILAETPFPEEKVDAVRHAVEVHDEYDYRGDPRPTETLAAEVLQDADNLDAIGAVGIARNFVFTGDYGNAMWDADGYGAKGHFHDKLLKLREEMNTGTGREMAERRHRFTEEFVERFEREWHGEV
ncbi:metal-dependent phosphohydrolase [Halobacteriales archaeon QS_8_69_26]|nr:MAG: metal-dependent phosphohydrolase [Halobacteriales archaeon QS_8_69_26]